MKVYVNNVGAIVLEDKVVCDAYDRFRAYMIVTHAHYDHMIGLRKALRRRAKVITTPPTKDLIVALGKARSDEILSIDYGRYYHISEGKMKLIKANHILGSAQVIYEKDEVLIAYTGDFRQPGTPIIEDPDILIIEATYGNPSFVRPSLEDIYNAFLRLVKRGLNAGRVNIFGYHGKIQEAMEVIRREIPDVPFLTSRRIYNLSKVAMKHGMKIGTVIPIDSEEASEILRDGEYIVFYHSNYFRRIRQGVNILLTGWNYKRVVRKISSRNFVVSLSGHADFKQLMEYVEISKPRFLIIDKSRSLYASIFAKEVNRRLRVEAVPMP